MSPTSTLISTYSLPGQDYCLRHIDYPRVNKYTYMRYFYYQITITSSVISTAMLVVLVDWIEMC